MRNVLSNLFGSTQGNVWLKKLLHPRIRQLMHDVVHAARSAYVILEIPVLLETGHNSLITPHFSSRLQRATTN